MNKLENRFELLSTVLKEEKDSKYLIQNINCATYYYRKKVMDVNGQNGKPMLNGASNGAVHHITDHYHEKNGYATNIQTSIGSNPGGKEELINNFQKKIGQDMDLGKKST